MTSKAAASLGLAIVSLACSGAAPSQARPAGGGLAPTPTPDLERPLPDPLPSVAARVNGQPIAIGGVRNLARKFVATEDKISATYRKALEQLIDRELLFEEALDRHIAADDAAVQRAYDEARVGHPDDASWALFLKGESLDPETFRTELRAHFTVEALVRQEREKVPPVSEDEALKYYAAHPAAFETGERIQAHRIFFRVPEGAPVAERDAARARAEGVLARLSKGEDFETLARQVSQDRATSAQGGKLPPFARGQVEPPLAAAAFALAPGSLSGVIATREGFDILRVDERLPSLKIPFGEAKQQIQASLRAEAARKRIASLVQSLRARARIEKFL